VTTLNEKIADTFIRHDVDLQRLQADQRRLILIELRKIETKIVAKLQGMAGDSFTKARQQALLSSVRDLIKSGYQSVLTVHRAESLDMARFESAHLVTMLNAKMGASVFAIGVPDSVITSMLKDNTVLGAPLRTIWSQEAGTLTQAFISEMRQGILASETTDDLIRRVRGTKAMQYKDGIMNPRERAVEMRVRTSAQSILNDARMETYKKNSDVLNGVQWQSVLDARTSEICIALSGQSWDMEGNPLPGTEQPFPGPPPAHPNCRSTLIPIVKSIGDLLGDPSVDEEVNAEVNKIPKATQASMDGQVAGTLSYEDWLRTKPVGFQQEVLGAGKYKLWAAGKIQARDLIDQRGNPLTLAQLKALDGPSAQTGDSGGGGVRPPSGPDAPVQTDGITQEAFQKILDALPAADIIDTPAVRTISSGEISSRKPVDRKGINISMQVTFSDGTQAIWKPMAGESRNARAGIKDGTMYRREAVTYDIAKIVGNADLVPPTVVREVNGEVGSMQAWQQGARVAVEMQESEVLGKFPDEVRRSAVQNFILGNTDRHQGNWMVTADGHMKLIDNGLVLSSIPKNFLVLDYLYAMPLRVQTELISEPYLAAWRDAAKWKQVEAAMRAQGIEEKAIEQAGVRRTLLLAQGTGTTWKGLATIEKGLV